MAAARVLPDSAQRDVSGTSTGLLAKFARSPSRKHRPRPSSESIDVNLSVSATRPNKLRARPSNTRTNTAPTDVSLGLNHFQGGDFDSKKNGDATGQQTADTTNNMYTVTAVSPGEAIRQPTFKSVPRPPENAFGIPGVPQIDTMALGVSANTQHNPNTLYQHIHDTSSKRIATLDYMRKVHEGRTFWFNTVQFSKTDISRLPSYTPNRLARRATNYMLLGMSIPAVLDVHPQPHPSNSTATNTSIATEYLKSLNSLLMEFETFQQFHPPDGSSASSLSRARIPHMFKRSAARPRKSSGAPVAEIGLPLQQSISAPSMPEGGHGHSHQTSVDGPYSNASFSTSGTTLVTPMASGPSNTAVAFSATQAFPPSAPFDAPNSTLLPSEGPYTYLLTPPLAFAPDFHTVFATLCEVLIDIYQRLLQLLSSPNAITTSMSELFTKVDSRIRKVMVGGILRELENTSRENAKRELLGVQKVVLGGLMGT